MDIWHLCCCSWFATQKGGSCKASVVSWNLDKPTLQSQQHPFLLKTKAAFEIPNMAEMNFPHLQWHVQPNLGISEQSSSPRKRSVNGQSTLGKWVNRWSTNPHFRLTKNRPSCPAAAAFCCSCKEAARWICTACELEKFSNPGSLSPQKGLLVKEFPMFQHFWMVIWLIHFPFSNIFGWS